MRQRLPDRPGPVRYGRHLCVHYQQTSCSQPNGGRRRSFDVTVCRVIVWAYRTSKMLSSWIVVFICVERFIAVCFFAANEDDMHKARRMRLHSSYPTDLRGLQRLPGLAGYVNSPGNLRAHTSDSFKCCRWKSSSFEHQHLYDCRSRRNVHAQSASQNLSGKIVSQMTAMLLATNAACPCPSRISYRFFPVKESVPLQRSSGRCVSGDHHGLRASQLFRQLLPLRLV